MMDMRSSGPPDLTPYLARLQELPFIADADVVAHRADTREQAVKLVLRDGANLRAIELPLQVSGTERLTEAWVQRALSLHASMTSPGILFAPYIASPTAHRFASHNLNFVDLAGNCRLALGNERFAMIEGRRPVRDMESKRGIGVPGYRVMFELLASEAARRLPIRELASRAGAGKSSTAVALRRLEEAGLLLRTQAGIRVTRPRELFERWLVGQLDHVMPRTLAGRFRTAETDPLKFETKAEAALSEYSEVLQAGIESSQTPAQSPIEFAWGGTAAAWRMHHYFRGTDTILHVSQLPPSLANRLGLLPSMIGNLKIYEHGTIAQTAFRGTVSRAMHPMLVYSDLIASGEERSMQTAEMIRKEFLRDWS